MFLSCPLKEGHGVKDRCQKFFRKTEFEKKGSLDPPFDHLV